LFLLGMLWIQGVGWLHIDNSRLPGLPVPIVALDSLSDEMSAKFRSPSKAQWWMGLPMAQGPKGELWVWDQIPRGLRLSFLSIDPGIQSRDSFHPGTQGHSSLRSDDLDCLSMFLSLRGQVVAPQFLREGDYVLIASAYPYSPHPEPRAGSIELSAPVHYQWNNLGSVFPEPVFLQLRRVQSIR